LSLLRGSSPASPLVWANHEALFSTSLEKLSTPVAVKFFIRHSADDYSFMYSLLFTVTRSSTTGSLRLLPGPAISGVHNQRVGYANGDVVTIQYSVGHVGDEIMSFLAPTVTWLKDGKPISHTLTTTTMWGSGGVNTTLSFTFKESDAGVYQCAFTGTTRSQVLVTDPVRLDTGTGTCRRSYTYDVLIAVARRSTDSTGNILPSDHP
jgi:hypothetical protein